MITEQVLAGKICDHTVAGESTFSALLPAADDCWEGEQPWERCGQRHAMHDGNDDRAQPLSVCPRLLTPPPSAPLRHRSSISS